MKRLTASCRSHDSVLFGSPGRTYESPPESSRRLARRVSLPITERELRDASRRGYIDQATAQEILERGGR